MKQAMGGLAKTRSDLALWTLFLLVVIAILMRLPGQFYPVTLHYDEGHDIWRAIGCFPPCGGASQPFLNRYLIFVAEGSYFVMGLATGVFHSVADLKEAFRADPRSLLFAGRLVSLVAGVATVPLTYLLGRRVWDPAVGLGGAMLVAVSPQLVIVSNNLRGWSLSTCLATLALLLMTRAITSTRRRDVLGAGAAVGAAVAAVYALALLLFPAVLALLLRDRALRVRRAERLPWVADLATAAAAGGVTFLILNFGGVWHWHQGLDELSELVRHESAFGSNVDYITNVSWYFASLFEPYGLGSVLASLALIGFIWTSWHRRPIAWVPLSFAAAVLVIQPLFLFFWASRYVAPAYPVLLLAASAPIVAAGRYIANRSPRTSWSNASAVATTLALLATAAANLKAFLTYEEALLRPPTRELAREWIESKIPQGTKLALNIQYISPVLLNCADLVAFHSQRRDTRPCYDVAYLPLSKLGDITVKQATDNARRALAELVDNGLKYVVYTDEVPSVTRGRLDLPDWMSTLLDSKYELVAEFFYNDLTSLPDDTATVDPKVKIYRVEATTQPD